jgi:hypothetical protein
VRHDHAASSVSGSPFQLFHTERNRLVMLVKCAPAALAARAVLRFPLSAASYALHGNPSRALVHVRAFASFLGLLPHAVRERRRVRGRGTVDDATIIARLAVD